MSDSRTCRTIAWRSRRTVSTSSSEGRAARSHGMPRAGEVEVPQGLDEGPLVVHAAVERRVGKRPRTRDGALPQPLQDRPRLTDPVTVVGAHPRPIGHAAVQLGFDERCDVDAVHDDVPHLAADLHVDQLDAPQAAPAEQGAADRRPREVDSMQGGVVEEHPVERGAPEAHALEACSGQVLLAELGHGPHARTGSPPVTDTLLALDGRRTTARRSVLVTFTATPPASHGLREPGQASSKISISPE